MLRKPLPGWPRLVLGAGLALLASTATATALWQARPPQWVHLPAIAPPTPAATLPGLAVATVALPAPRPATLATPRVVPLVPALAALSFDAVPALEPAPVALDAVAPIPNETAMPRDVYRPPVVRHAAKARVPVYGRAPITQIAEGVIVQVELDAAGNLVSAKVVQSDLPAIFERNALSALKRWRFEPAVRNGVAEPATVLVPVGFQWRTMASRGQEPPVSNRLPGYQGMPSPPAAPVPSGRD